MTLIICVQGTTELLKIFVSLFHCNVHVFWQHPKNCSSILTT